MVATIAQVNVIHLNDAVVLYYNLCKKAEIILGGYKNDIWLKTD